MNAFTDTPFTGNPCGVVPDADALSDEDMQRIAPELNSISETVFICSPRDSSADLRLRYFTSTTEVDLCGHATISALFALAGGRQFNGNDGLQIVRAETNVGVLELGLTFAKGVAQSASMTQLPPEFGEPTAADHIPEVLGIDAGKIRKDLATGCCSTGIWACYVPLIDADALRSVSIRSELIEGIWPEKPQLAGIYPFVITDNTSAPETLHTQGRFFSPPKYGIVEDPVTGTASGALGGWLMRQGVLAEHGLLHARQGVEMGRPGEVRVQREANGAMRVSGQAVTVLRGKIIF